MFPPLVSATAQAARNVPMYLPCYKLALSNKNSPPSLLAIQTKCCDLRFVRFLPHNFAGTVSSLRADMRVIYKIAHKQSAKGMPTGLAILMKSLWVRFFHIDSWNGLSLI